jgi:hypothetical protein
MKRNIYLKGLTVRQDKAEGLKWIQLAANNGNTTAITLLGKLTTNNPSATNSANSLASPTNNALLPSIVVDHAPITMAINYLARAAEINYILVPNLFPVTDSNGNVIEEEPVVTFRLKGVEASDVLERMLNLYKLVLIKDPVTTVARVARINQKVNFIDASLIGVDTNKVAEFTNGVVPSIVISKVPLDAALKTFIKQCTPKIELSGRITGIADGGNTTNKEVFPDSRFVPMPEVSLDWKNLTAKQALIALCQDCDLDIVKDANTGVIQIIPKP